MSEAALAYAMAMHDRAGSDRLLHGSVAEEVIHRSPVPVTLIRAAEGLRPAEGFHREQPAMRGSVAGAVVHPSTCPGVLGSPAWERRPAACAPSCDKVFCPPTERARQVQELIAAADASAPTHR